MNESRTGWLACLIVEEQVEFTLLELCRVSGASEVQARSRGPGDTHLHNEVRKGGPALFQIVEFGTCKRLDRFPCDIFTFKESVEFNDGFIAR